MKKLLLCTTTAGRLALPLITLAYTWLTWLIHLYQIISWSKISTSFLSISVIDNMRYLISLFKLIDSTVYFVTSNVGQEWQKKVTYQWSYQLIQPLQDMHLCHQRKLIQASWQQPYQSKWFTVDTRFNIICDTVKGNESCGRLSILDSYTTLWQIKSSSF